MKGKNKKNSSEDRQSHNMRCLRYMKDEGCRRGAVSSDACWIPSQGRFLHLWLLVLPVSRCREGTSFRWAWPTACWPSWLFIPQTTQRTHWVSHLLPFLVLTSANLDLWFHQISISFLPCLPIQLLDPICLVVCLSGFIFYHCYKEKTSHLYFSFSASRVTWPFFLFTSSISLFLLVCHLGCLSRHTRTTSFSQ